MLFVKALQQGINPCKCIPNYMYCNCLTSFLQYVNLLPTGSEELGVLGVASIPVATLPSCQDVKSTSLKLHKHEYSWVVKIRNTSLFLILTYIIIYLPRKWRRLLKLSKGTIHSTIKYHLFCVFIICISSERFTNSAFK